MEAYDHDPASYPWCVCCRLPMKKAGNPQGFQNYQCRQCRNYYRDGARLHLLKKPARRRYLAAIRWEPILEEIRQATAGLPPDVREEVIQEMALAALDGQLELAEISGAVAFYRRKVSRQMDRFRIVSLDQPIGDEGGLTYAESLPG